MTRAFIVVAALVAAGGAARAQEPAPPTTSQAPATRAPERRPWAPIGLLYRQIDMRRQNVGANGRKNATRDEQQYGERPSNQGFDQRPLSDW